MNIYKFNKMCSLFFCSSVSVSLSQRPRRGGGECPSYNRFSLEVSLKLFKSVDSQVNLHTQRASVCVVGAGNEADVPLAV